MFRFFFIYFFIELIVICSEAQTFIIYKGDTINVIDKNGYRQGKWIFFDKNYKDSISAEGYYKDGNKAGVWKTYYQNGNIMSIITYQNNKKDGIAKIYYPNGKLREEGYWRENKWIGEYKAYYPDGKLKYHFFFDKNGSRTGKQVYYYENGNKYIEGEWNSGKETGKMIEYYSNGKVHKVSNWLAGAKNGEELVYTEDGKLKTKTYYVNGTEDLSRRIVYNTTPKAEQIDTIRVNVDMEQEEGQNYPLFRNTGRFKIYDTQNHFLLEEGYFENGRLKDGKKYFYDSTGGVRKIIIYKNGKASKIIIPDNKETNGTDSLNTEY